MSPSSSRSLPDDASSSSSPSDISASASACSATACSASASCWLTIGPPTVFRPSSPIARPFAPGLPRWLLPHYLSLRNIVDRFRFRLALPEAQPALLSAVLCAVSRYPRAHCAVLLGRRAGLCPSC